MATLIITTNASQGTDVTIRDMGITITNSGGSETFTDSKNLLNAQLSVDLRTLTTDDAHGANSSTLILNDGTSDIAQADIDSYLSQVSGSAGATGLAGVTGIYGSTGLLGTTGILGNTGIQGVTGIGFADAAATATADTTTTSNTDVLVNSMSISSASLPAGTYAVWFTGSTEHSTNNIDSEMSIYQGTVAAGTQIASSERRTAIRTGGQVGFACFARITVNGSENIEGAWRTVTGTVTMHERSIYALRVA
jgi:hypothetical protein